MASAVDPSLANPREHSITRSLLTELSLHHAPSSSEPVNEENPGASSVDLLLPRNTPPLLSMTASPMTASPMTASPTTASLTKEDVVLSNAAAFSPAGVVNSSAKARPLCLDVNHDISELVGLSELCLPQESVPRESMPEKPLYPPPVSPTQTYQPPAPSLSMMHVTKSPTAINAPTSIFNRRSWHPSEYEHASAPISPITDSSGRPNRSASIASSGASSAYSANSATIQIPPPGTNAYTKKVNHKRQQSDPKYVRFMSAVSENHKKVEPDRYVGYPGLVSYMTETQSLIVRRFDDVHVRLLLYIQDQISQLETQLRTLDEQNYLEKGIHNGTFREDVDRVRVHVMERLRILVGEYDTMVLAFSRMQESKASEKAVGRLKEWLRKYSGISGGGQSPPKGGAIARDELEWVEKANDLTDLSISPPTNAVVKQSPLTRLFPGMKR
jgi:hypothetical protein